jgi:hypothetical protein
VVASKNRQSISESDLQTHEQCNCLNRVISSVNIISHEQVIGLRGLPTDAKKFFQVMELPVNISAYGDWSANNRHVRLLNQNFLCSLAELLDVALTQRLTLHEDFNVLV